MSSAIATEFGKGVAAHILNAFSLLDRHGLPYRPAVTTYPDANVVPLEWRDDGSDVEANNRSSLQRIPFSESLDHVCRSPLLQVKCQMGFTNEGSDAFDDIEWLSTANGCPLYETYLRKVVIAFERGILAGLACTYGGSSFVHECPGRGCGAMPLSGSSPANETAVVTLEPYEYVCRIQGLHEPIVDATDQGGGAMGGITALELKLSSGRVVGLGDVRRMLNSSNSVPHPEARFDLELPENWGIRGFYGCTMRMKAPEGQPEATPAVVIGRLGFYIARMMTEPLRWSDTLHRGILCQMPSLRTFCSEVRMLLLVAQHCRSVGTEAAAGDEAPSSAGGLLPGEARASGHSQAGCSEEVRRQQETARLLAAVPTDLILSHIIPSLLLLHQRTKPLLMPKELKMLEGQLAWNYEMMVAANHMVADDADDL